MCGILHRKNVNDLNDIRDIHDIQGSAVAVSLMKTFTELKFEPVKRAEFSTGYVSAKIPPHNTS